jgi:hypothetical protein
MEEEQKISKSEGTVIPKVCCYNYIRIIIWGGACSTYVHCYTKYLSKTIDWTQRVWIFRREDQYQTGSLRYEVRKYKTNFSTWGDMRVSAEI